MSRRFPHFRAGQKQIPAGQLNAMVDALNDMADLRGDGYITVNQVSGGGRTIGLNINRVRSHIGRPGYWYAQIIDGRDEGFTCAYYHASDSASYAATGYYVEDVRLKSLANWTTGPQWEAFYPSRTRTATNAYIPTVLYPYNSGWWPISFREVREVPTNASAELYESGDGVKRMYWRIYVGHYTAAFAKCESDAHPNPSEYTTIIDEAFEYYTGCFSINDLNGAWYDVPPSDGLRILMQRGENAAAGVWNSFTNAYPTLNADERVPVTPYLLCASTGNTMYGLCVLSPTYLDNADNMDGVQVPPTSQWRRVYVDQAARATSGVAIHFDLDT